MGSRPVADSSTSPGACLKIWSLETSGTPGRRAVAAIQRSACWSRWLSADRFGRHLVLDSTRGDSTRGDPPGRVAQWTLVLTFATSGTVARRQPAGPQPSWCLPALPRRSRRRLGQQANIGGPLSSDALQRCQENWPFRSAFISRDDVIALVGVRRKDRPPTAACGQVQRR